MLGCTCLKRGGPVTRIVRSHPWRQPAPVSLLSPSLEPLLGVTVRLGSITRKPGFSTHAAPICRLFVPYSPLCRTGRDRLPNLEVKVGNCYSIPLRFGMLATLRICLADKTRACFIVCATTMDVEGWWR